jgi:hypothetical protein
MQVALQSGSELDLTRAPSAAGVREYRSDHALGQHRVRDLYETGDIGTIGIVH